MGEKMDVKKAIYDKGRELGISLIRTTSVESWMEEPIQAEDFWPQNIWPWCTRVIVLGIPLFLPMADTTPSMVYQELYDTSNRIMDDSAYRLAGEILGMGYRAAFFPRDCYDGIEVLLKNPSAAFSHVVAAYYAGMGTIGDSHNLITKEFGPRVRIVSVLTDAPIEADPRLAEDLCIHCRKCLKACPARCFSEKDTGIYSMDKDACTRHHVKLKEEHHFPCGICANICPIGEDRKMYRSVPPVTLAGIRHVQSYGS